MKRNTFVLIGLYLIFYYGGLKAQVVSQETARQVADNFFCSQFSLKSLEHMDVLPLGNKRQPTMYAFSLSSHWVLVAGDKRVQPILAYSDENGGEFPDEEDMPDGMLYLLEWYNDQIESLRSNNVAREDNPQWSAYLVANNRSFANRNVVVSPLLTRNGDENLWRQGWNNSAGLDTTKYYNKFCPILSECPHRAVVGCAALALGQVMWYWKWPYAAIMNTGNGDMVHRYDWDAMPVKLYDSTNVYNVDMVAILLADCGASINMNYGCSQSGIPSNEVSIRLKNAFIDDYSYNAQDYKRADYTNSAWIDLLKNELNNSRPIYYSGIKSDYSAGHAFVLDGYDSENRFHANMGGGGGPNGYYMLDSIPAGTLYFSREQQAVFVHPVATCPSSSLISNTIIDENFTITNDYDIIFNNVTFSGDIHGYVTSSSSITLNPGTCIINNAEVIFGISDVPCEERVNAIPDKKIEQSYQNLKYADRWKVLVDCNTTVYPHYWVESNYSVLKDTIIGNYTYQLLSNNRGAIRYSDDGMKFYYLSKSGEYLLCDFSLQVGDTCYAYIGTATYENEENSLQDAGFNLVQPWVVTSREIIDKRVHIKMSWCVEELNYTFETEMIQGIGSNRFIFPMQTGFMMIGGAPSYTLCAFKEDDNIYSFDLTEEGIKNDCPNWEMIPKEAIETIPADISSATKLLRDGQILILRNGKTYTITGQRIE